MNLLQSQWGSLFTNTEDFIGEAAVPRDGRTIVWRSQENRQHLLGHMILMGLKEPVFLPGLARLASVVGGMSRW